MPPNGRNDWDGRDRRSYEERRGRDERRDYSQQPSYFEQMILQHLQQQQIPQQFQASSPKSSADKDITQSTLTLQQIGSIIVVLSSLVFGGFSAWSSLNKEIEMQKSTFTTFKESISKDAVILERNLQELKKATDDLRQDNVKSMEQMERRIQDLDISVSQIYQKVNTRSTK